MERRVAVLVASFFLLLALPGAAQQESGTLAQEFWVKVKPSMAREFEAAYGVHNEWHRNNDSWEWQIWQVLVGEKVGSYVVRTGGHHWADFDAHSKTLAAGGENFSEYVAGTIDSMSSRIVRFLPELSAWPEDMDRPAFVTVLEYRIRYGAAAEFSSALRKINEGFRNSDLPFRGAAWFAVVCGERKGSTYVLVFPHKNWADMKAPEKSFWTRVEEIFGRQEAENLRETYRRSIVSRTSSILAYRPDLSSVPGGN